MANMTVSTERNAPGISVFWLVLAITPVIVALLALMLTFSEGDDEYTTSEQPVLTNGEDLDSAVAADLSDYDQSATDGSVETNVTAESAEVSDTEASN